MINLFAWLQPKFKSRYGVISGSTKTMVCKDWEEIDNLIESGLPSQLRQAVIIADRSLDCVLKDISSGESMGDRLKNAKDRISDNSLYQTFWDVHKIRNALVHESGYNPPHYVLKEAIDKYRDGLNKLGIQI